MSAACKWSPAQLKAIEERGKNLLVAAAAGSGKTSVLVERIIRRILQGETDVDRLLVVTFTNAAAAEMRERIEAALAQEIAKGTASPRLERQLALLSNASISTLHSFCQNVIRRNFAAIDLDPKFRLANEQEVRLLKQETLEEIFEKKYEEAQEDFLSFAAAYGTERGDEALYAMVLRLYTFSCSQPFPSIWLDSLAESFDLADNRRLLDTPWAQSVLARISFALADCLAAIERLIEKSAVLGYEACHAALEGDEQILKNLLAALETGDWESLRQAFFGYAHARMSFPRGMDEEEKEEAKRLFTVPRDRVKQTLKKLKETYFHSTEEELLEDLCALSGTAHAIVDVVKDFAAAFQAAKKERGIVDFNDLEHFALAVLCSGDASAGELRPSAQALALRERYEEVMVDEYQDTNGVQEAILSLVARGDNLFVVGDVKQSIYRFRLADPQLFLKKQQEYPTLGEKYARIDLSENYRSRSGVLAAVNWIFSQLMTPEAMELTYDDAAALHFAALYPADSEKSLAGATELYIIESDAEFTASVETGEEEETAAGEDGGAQSSEEGEEEEELKGFALEATFIARRVRELMASGALVADKGNYRPLHWRDIVILLRAARDRADILLETLRDADIPSYAALDAGYFQATEVRVLLSVLAVIDNARQDVPLAAVLCSPIVGLTVSELAELRLAAPEEDIFGALLVVNDPAAKFSASLCEKIDAFLKRLKDWRDLVRRVSVPELIWQIYRDTGYYDYVGGMAGGLLRQANLRMLADRARDYEETNFRGLFRFLRFIEKMQQMETDLSAARTLGEGEDVVRIMTIHKSKGLEFPVVIVAGLGSKFNMRDAADDLLMHRELGLGLYRTVREKSLRYSTFAREAVAERIRQESKAEELRVLYVAMTRAREKLILVGSAKKLAVRAETWCNHVMETKRQLPAYAALAANSFLDWLGMTVARHADGAPLWAKASLIEDRVAPEGEDDSRWQVKIVPASAVASVCAAVPEEDEVFEKLRRGEPLSASVEKDAVEQMLAWQYAQHGVDDVPAKLSVTELKRRFSVEDAAEEKPYAPLKKEYGGFSGNVFKRPDFMQKKTGLSASEYGTLMHAVLQHIDLAGDANRQGLEAQLAAMVEKELFLPEQAKAVRLDAVASFLRSPLGARMKKARRLWRELPFSRRLEARRFYPEAEPEARIFVQGVIDVLFEDENGAFVLLDYKTDKDTAPAPVREKYRLQIELYTEAVEAILGCKVDERCLYLLQDGSVVQL